jgi:hypothetical protein
MPPLSAVQAIDDPDFCFQQLCFCGFAARSTSKEGAHYNARIHMTRRHGKEKFDAQQHGRPCEGQHSVDTTGQKRRQLHADRVDAVEGTGNLCTRCEHRQALLPIATCCGL